MPRRVEPDVEPAGTPTVEVPLTQNEVWVLFSIIQPGAGFMGYEVGRALIRKLSAAQVVLDADARLTDLRVACKAVKQIDQDSLPDDYAWEINPGKRLRLDPPPCPTE